MKPTNPEVDAPRQVIGPQNETANIGSLTLCQVKDPAIPDDPDAQPQPWNAWLAAFRLDEDERKRIAAGADIYFSQITGHNGMPHGMGVYVGKEAAATAYRLPVLAPETLEKRAAEAEEGLEGACRNALEALALVRDPRKAEREKGEYSIGDAKVFAQRRMKVASDELARAFQRFAQSRLAQGET